MERIVAACIVAGLLQGCSAFTPPKMKPVIEDRISTHSRDTVGVLATTPERRVFLVKMPGQLFCAEPSADAADNVAYALSAMVDASTKTKAADIKGGLSQSLQTSVRQLFQRSQGIQLYRDGTFALCNAYMNKAITEKEFLAERSKLLEVAERLIALEIPHLHELKFDVNTKLDPPHASVELSRKPEGADQARAGQGGALLNVPAEDAKKEVPGS